MQAASAIIAGIALVVSVVVFVDSRRQAKQTARLARRPALVFTWDGRMTRWTLSNIGNGPALDVVVIQRFDGRWQHPLRMPEMAVDQDVVVPRLWSEKWHENPGLGARYRSIAGEQYLTQTGDDWSQITDGWGDIPSASWSGIEPHWQYAEEA